jgi:hypothetical protein
VTKVQLFGGKKMIGPKGVVALLKERKGTPPCLLYRYGVFDQWTHRIFQNNQVYFSSPDSFNDPFDSAVRFACEGSKQQRKKFFREFMPLHKPNLSRRESLLYEKQFKERHWDDGFLRGFQQDRLKVRHRMGVFCLTEKKDDILMWSHYAKYHTGFCLEFQTNDSFFSNANPVNYSDRRPVVNLLIPDWNELVVANVEALLTKAKHWEYEKEWRIIDLQKNAGIHQFPPTVLHGVILGCRISSTDREQVVKWCKGRSPIPSLYQAQMKETEYGLTIKPFDY